MATKRITLASSSRVVGIDWSGRVDTPGQRRHIWAGIWTEGPNGIKVALEAGRTRGEVADWLIALAAETPQMVVGIDCCFSYPAWFLKERRCKSAFDFWQHANSGHGETWLQHNGDDPRFWGKPHKRPAEFSGDNLHRMMRLTDWDNKIAQAHEGGDPERAAKMRGITPKSPFQIGGSGTVGTGSLRAMPVLHRLHQSGFRVWPFESAQPQRPLLVEIYTRLMTGPVAKSNAIARKAYLAAKKKSDALYAGITRSIIQKAEGSEDAFDALVSTLEMVRYRTEFAGLRATPDPALKLEGITWRPGISG